MNACSTGPNSNSGRKSPPTRVRPASAWRTPSPTSAPRNRRCRTIYHCNFGAPLLENGARFVAALRRVTPFNAHAARDVERFAEYSGPTRGAIEQVYCLQPAADSTGRSAAMIQNARADRGVALSFSVEQLPFFTLWKNLTSPEDGYVTGLEPGTGFPFNRRIERLAGRVPRLAPGASRKMTIDVTALLGRDDVSRAAAEIKRIQGGTQVQIDREPFKTPTP
jgi:hypothetical protein